VRANNLLADPVIAGIIVNVRDVTERRQMEEALRESETLAALGRMAARVAHEINNPLAGVKNALLLIKDAISPTHPDVKYLSWADKEIDQIASIVRQMLTLQTPVREPAKECHADKVIRDVVALLTAGGRKSNVTVTLDLPTTPLVVCLAENSLRQLVFNLVAHAIEIAPPGGTVKIAVVASPEKLELTVVNHNNGLPAAPSTHYFEPVLPLQNGKSQGGLGIGVSVAKMLVEAMNGSFQHQHEGEKGAMVHVGLPLWSSRGMGRDD
jgi:signal transduction histidine kinase